MRVKKTNKKEHQKYGVINSEIIKNLLSMPKDDALQLLQRVNYKLNLQKEDILNQAIDEKILTKEEYKEKYEDMFYDDFGADSFLQYLNASMNTKDIDYFVTENLRLLNKREDIEKKFKLKIISLKELEELDKKESN